MHSRYHVLTILCVAPLCPTAKAQPPVITRIVNAASFAGPPYDKPAPGSIATIFGERLATATVTASPGALPRILGGVTVVIEGTAAPIFYVSPSQINFQVPFGDWNSPNPTPLALQWKVVVRNQLGASETYNVQVTDSAPGMFTLDGSGCGRGAILNHLPDGRVSVNSEQSSIDSACDQWVPFP